MKKFLSYILAIICILSMGILSVSCKDDKSNNKNEQENKIELAYKLLPDESGYSVVGVKNTDYLIEELVIPETYNGKPVKEIADYAFYCNGIYNLSIPNSVVRIGRLAFCGSYLSSLIIPDSVEIIEALAFDSNCRLLSVTLGSGLKIIDMGAFERNHIVEIINKSNLNITNGSEDFGGIANNALFIHSDGNSKIDAIDDYLFTTYNGNNYLLGYKGRECDLVLPDYYKGQNYKIYKNAFSYDGTITSVVLSDGVTGICSRAFSYCYNLLSFTLDKNLVDFQDCFYGISVLEVVNNSSLSLAELEKKYEGEDVSGLIGYRYEYGKDVIISEKESKIKTVGNYKFITNNNINYLLKYMGTEENIVLPQNYNGQNYVIYKEAFNVGSVLTSITIPSSVTSIEYGTFFDCEKLVEVINKSNLDITLKSEDNGYIGYYAKTVHNGENGSKIVTTTDGYQFITGDDGINYLFNYIGTATELTLPENYNGQNYVINGYAFDFNNKITSVKIPDSVTSIGKYAFIGTDNLETIYYTGDINGWVQIDGLTNLMGFGNYIKNLYIQGALLTEANITTATKISDGAFQSCTSLTSLTIGNSVTSIGYKAFYGCSGLASVTFENGNGWKAGDIDISSTDLADTSIASEYLKNTYWWNVWTRES